MSTKYFRPELHGQTDSERRTRLAVMRSIRNLVAQGIKSDWEALRAAGKHIWIVDGVFGASRRPE